MSDYCAHGTHRNAFHCASCADGLMATDKPCEDCVFVPTPGGKCICREVAG